MFGEFSETAAAVDAQNYEEAVQEMIETAFGMDEGGFATLDPGARMMLLENAPTIPIDWNAPAGVPLTCNELATISAPALMIVGSETPAANDLMVRAIAACVPNAEIAVIQGVGHGGPLQTQDEFVKLTLDFIDAH